MMTIRNETGPSSSRNNDGVVNFRSPMLSNLSLTQAALLQTPNTLQYLTVNPTIAMTPTQYFPNTLCNRVVKLKS